MQDIDKRSMIWEMFMSSTLEASVFMGKDYSENLHSIKNTGNDLTLKQMFDISEKLIVGQADGIFECHKSTGKIFHGDNYLWLMMKKSPVYRMQRFMYFQKLCLSWKGESEPYIQCCLGRTIELVQKIHHNTDLWTQLTESRWNSSGIFPRIHHIAAHQQSPRVHEQNERPSTIPGTI